MQSISSSSPLQKSQTSFTAHLTKGTGVQQVIFEELQDFYNSASPVQRNQINKLVGGESMPKTLFKNIQEAFHKLTDELDPKGKVELVPTSSNTIRMDYYDKKGNLSEGIFEGKPSSFIIPDAQNLTQKDKAIGIIEHVAKGLNKSESAYQTLLEKFRPAATELESA